MVDLLYMGKTDFGEEIKLFRVDANMKRKAASRERGQDTFSRAQARPLLTKNQKNIKKLEIVFLIVVCDRVNQTQPFF